MNVFNLPNYVLICAIPGLSIVVLLIIGVLYDTIKKIKRRINNKGDDSMNAKDSTSIDIRILIYLNLYLILTNMILLLFRFLYININVFANNHNDKYCTLISKIAMLLFQLTRTIMYIIFIRRLQVIYVGTMFELKSKYIYILYAMTAIYAITFISYIHWPALFISKYNHYFGCSISYTLYIYQPILFSFISIMDLLISVCCLYLFIYPLWQLVQHQDDKEIKNQLYSLMIKFSILQSAAICSAFVLIVISFSFLFGYYFLMIDGLINGTMLILLNPLHNSCYKRICCVCHKCCFKGCNQFAMYQKIKTNSDVEAVPPDFFNRLKLSRISVSENKCNHITDVDVLTPIDLLLSQANNAMRTNSLRGIKKPNIALEFKSMSNMYKNASTGQAAFGGTQNIGGIKGIKSPTNQTNTLYKTKLNFPIETQSKSPGDEPISPNNVINIETPTSGVQMVGNFKSTFIPPVHEIRESTEVEATGMISIRDAMRNRVNQHFDAKKNQTDLELKLNKLNLSKHSTSIQSERSAKTNTLVLIDYESTCL